MQTTITPFLMFQGDAGPAMDLYASVFPGANVEFLNRYPDDAGEMAGKVAQAQMTVAGQVLRFYDSTVEHAFTFTPSLSLFVDCVSDDELTGAFATLSEGGRVLMPLGDYGFSQRFGWCDDRFGVSWQLNLAHPVS